MLDMIILQKYCSAHTFMLLQTCKIRKPRNINKVVEKHWQHVKVNCMRRFGICWICWGVWRTHWQSS